jgi:hypothetical protein
VLAPKTLAEQILGSVGEYFWVKEETMLDAVTALSTLKGSAHSTRDYYFKILLLKTLNCSLCGAIF